MAKPKSNHAKNKLLFYLRVYYLLAAAAAARMNNNTVMKTKLKRKKNCQHREAKRTQTTNVHR